VAIIYYSKLSPSSVSATTAQGGFPPTNASLEAIGRPWLATSAGANDLILNLAAAQNVAGLLLQDVNFAAASIFKSADGSTFSLVGTFTSYADKITGRRRGLIVINDPTVKAVKISIGSGSTTDGTTGWRVGAAYIFGASAALARLPQYHTKPRGVFPTITTPLPNGQVAQAVTGQDILELSMPFDRRFDEDVLDLVRRCRKATVGLFLAPNNYPELVLPVRFIKEELEEDMDVADYTAVTVELRERV
jgi:hypothetical protein